MSAKVAPLQAIIVSPFTGPRLTRNFVYEVKLEQYTLSRIYRIEKIKKTCYIAIFRMYLNTSIIYSFFLVLFHLFQLKYPISLKYILI